MMMVEYAIRYQKKGVSVIPLKKNKRPYLTSWLQWQKERPTEEKLKEWWKTWPDAQIGIITGAISGLTVLDIDVAHGGRLDDFNQNTTIIGTGNKGYHLYYKYHPGLGNKAGVRPGVDIRGDAGYVVAPPSITDYIDETSGDKKGGPYTVLNTLPFATFPFETVFGIGAPLKPKTPLKELVGISTGGRNSSLASVIGKLILIAKEEEWDSEIFPVIESINKTYNPPLSDYEVKITYRSICSIEKRRRETFEKEKNKITDEKVKEFLTAVQKEIGDDIQKGEAMERLINIAKTYAGEDMLEDSQEILKRISSEPEELRIMSGYSSLDKILKGFRQGQLVIISGFTKQGKTNFLMDLTDNMMIYNPIWIPLEEGSEDLVRKFKERDMSPPHWYSPRTIKSVSLPWIESRIVEGIAKYNTKVVMIDQLDFIVPLQSRDHHQMIGETVRQIRSLARKWGVCIFLICHLNGQAKMGIPPSMENLKGSTSISQEADTVILIWRETERSSGEIIQSNNTVISVQANRRTGNTGNVRMIFNGIKYEETEWESSKEKTKKSRESFDKF